MNATFGTLWHLKHKTEFLGHFKQYISQITEKFYFTQVDDDNNVVKLRDFTAMLLDKFGVNDLGIIERIIPLIDSAPMLTFMAFSMVSQTLYGMLDFVKIKPFLVMPDQLRLAFTSARTELLKRSQPLVKETMFIREQVKLEVPTPSPTTLTVFQQLLYNSATTLITEGIRTGMHALFPVFAGSNVFNFVYKVSTDNSQLTIVDSSSKSDSMTVDASTKTENTDNSMTKVSNSETSKNSFTLKVFVDFFKSPFTRRK